MINEDEKQMLMCTVATQDNGDIKLIKRDGRKEDTMSVASFLSQVYGRPVAIMFV
jgi:hypothetical protein